MLVRGFVLFWMGYAFSQPLSLSFLISACFALQHSSQRQRRTCAQNNSKMILAVDSMWEAWEGAYISYTRDPIRRRKRQGQEEWHFGILNRRFQSKTAFSVGKDQTPCTLCTHAPVIFRNRHLNLVSPIWLSPWCHVGQLCLRSASLVSW